jgi:anti-sigma factor RsiW
VNCPEARTWLNGYLDGELDLPRAVEIEQHLEECGRCSRAHENHRALRDSLGGARLVYRCPEHARAKIEAAVSRVTRRADAPPHFSRPWLAVAAAVMLTALGVWFAMRPMSVDNRIGQEVVASHVRSLLADHLTDVASSDRHTVKPWFAGKLDFAPTVVDLSAEGFPLVGGRLDYLDRRPVAALVYTRRKHLINVFLWPAERTAGEVTPLASVQGFQIFQWNDAGTSCWAISDLNGGELRQFVELFRAARQ